MIESLLTQLGFSEKETQVYLTVLRSGKISPSNVAKLTKINRTTVYSIAKDLQEKGVIQEDLGKSQRYLVAIPPEEWNKILVRKEEKKLAERKGLISDAVQELVKFATKTKYVVPKIVFVAQEEIEAHLYKQTPIWNESLAQYDNTWWGFQDTHFVEHYEKWIDWYWVEGSPKNMQLKLLSNESAEVVKKKKYSNRQIKFWKEGKDFSATTWINGDYVVIVVSNAVPRYLVQIHDAVLAHNLREVFKGVWKNLV